MGKSEKRALRSQLARLIAHLLKWAYQPQRRRPVDIGTPRLNMRAKISTKSSTRARVSAPNRLKWLPLATVIFSPSAGGNGIARANFPAAFRGSSSK